MLCDRCRYGRTVGGHHGKELRVCTNFAFENKLIDFEVTRCNAFDQTGVQTLEQMENTALYVTKPKEKLGFKWVKKDEFERTAYND